MEPVKLGIIGCGVIGQSHLQAASASARIDVVALADLRRDVARQSAEEFDVSAVYDDGAQLLDDPNVEAVILALPAGVRTPLVLAALGKGKHVLIEKPVAMNAGEVRQMMAVQGDRVAASCSSRFHLMPSAGPVTEWLASGKLGPLRTLRVFAHRAAGPDPGQPLPAWRFRKDLNAGGCLVDWGCYDLDYMLGITGWQLVPKLVLAQTWTIPPVFNAHVVPESDAETHLAAFVLCEGGTVITLERGDIMPAAEQCAWQIVGEKGSLRLQMTPGQGKKMYYDDASLQRGVSSSTLWEGDESFADLPLPLVEDFAAAIRDRRPPQTDLARALVVQQITDAIYASAEQGRAVAID